MPQKTLVVYHQAVLGKSSSKKKVFEIFYGDEKNNSYQEMFFVLKPLQGAQ